METTTPDVPTVTIQGREIPLRPPSSLTVCREVLLAAGSNHQRACFAALGLCWVEPPKKKKKKRGGHVGRPSVRYSACDYNPLRFGGDFADALTAAGVPYEEMLAAGLRAFLLVAAQFPDEDEEEQAEGN